MKHKLIGLLALLTAAVVLLTACTSGTNGTSSGVDGADASAASGASDGSTASTVSAGDLFTDRDLKGTYDASDAVSVTLTGSTATCASDAVTIEDGAVTVTAEGTYVFSGTLDDGCIIVNAGSDDKVQLVLNGASITSSSFACIYVAQADKVFLTVADGTDNVLNSSGTITPIDDSKVDAAVFSRDDLTINGTGSLTVTAAAGHGVVSKDDLVVAGVTMSVTAAGHALAANDDLKIASGTLTLSSGKDGLHAKNSDDLTLGNVYVAGGTLTITASDDGIHANTLVQIDGGTITITAYEGIEGTRVVINDGTVTINASDDGVNATRRSTACDVSIEVNGGDITIVMGQGDTDGMDSNGSITINGGTVNVTGQSAFDYDTDGVINGGTVIVNGEQVDTLPNQFGGMGGFGPGGFGGGRPGGNGGNFNRGGAGEAGDGGDRGNFDPGNFGVRPGGGTDDGSFTPPTPPDGFGGDFDDFTPPDGFDGNFGGKGDAT